MKKYSFLALCIASSLYCAEPKILKLTTTPWPAEDYEKGCFIQEQAFSDFFNQHKIDIKGKKILDIGCGAGNISYLLAQEASFVTAIDQCPNMIEFSKNRYVAQKNLSFATAHAETFTSSQDHDCAISSFVFHWIEKKPEALQNIARHLKSGADFFFTAHTAENPKPLNLIIPEEMMQESWLVSIIKGAASWFASDKEAATGASYPNIQDLESMIEKSDFEIITIKELTSKVTIANREDLEKFHRPIMMSRPIVQKIPETVREWLFSSFIDKLIDRMEKTPDGKYVEVVTTTVVHARKK